MNTSKGVVRSGALSLCTLEEIRNKQKNQGIMDSRRVPIKKNGQMIQTYTYIITFNTTQIPTSIRKGHEINKDKQFILNPFPML